MKPKGLYKRKNDTHGKATNLLMIAYDLNLEELRVQKKFNN